MIGNGVVAYHRIGSEGITDVGYGDHGVFRSA